MVIASNNKKEYKKKKISKFLPKNLNLKYFFDDIETSVVGRTRRTRRRIFFSFKRKSCLEKQGRILRFAA